MQALGTVSVNQFGQYESIKSWRRGQNSRKAQSLVTVRSLCLVHLRLWPCCSLAVDAGAGCLHIQGIMAQNYTASSPHYVVCTGQHLLTMLLLPCIICLCVP